MIKTIRIYAKEYQTKNGGKFIGLSYTPDKVDYYTVKFKKTCINPIDVTGYWNLTVDTKNVSISKKDSTIWIGAYNSCVHDTEYEVFKKAENQKFVDDVLTQDTQDEKLPL